METSCDMTTLVNRGVTVNLMNTFPKSFFVKDVCPGSDQSMNCVYDSTAFIYSLIHLCTQHILNPTIVLGSKPGAMGHILK